MRHTRLMPLRTSVGPYVRIAEVTFTAHSPHLTDDMIRTPVWDGAAAITAGPPAPPFSYASMLPATLPGGTGPPIAPGAGSDRFHLPSDLPKGDTSHGAAIFVAGPVATEEISRELWIEMDLLLRPRDGREPLIGGIVLGGFPYLPGYVTRQREHSSNHGLPREIRVSWSDQHGHGFIDDEVSLTVQGPAFHGACTTIALHEPVRTSTLKLRVSDFPRLFRRVDSHRHGEMYGLCVPYLFVFEYLEATRYRSRVPLGLLGSTFSGEAAETPFGDDSHVAGAMAEPPADGLVQIDGSPGGDKQFLAFTAASALQEPGHRRQYPTAGVDEFFLSPLMRRGDRITLYLEQGEEHPRCAAGLTLLFAKREIVTRIAKGFEHVQFDVVVYEVDPPEGVSPLVPGHELAAYKYAHRLREKRIQGPSEVTVEFARPSASRHLAVTIEARTEGRIALEQIRLIQSAHVVITPCASRRRMVRTMNFRLIGPGLAHDYARLGAPGFHFTVERVVAHETREVLFAASTLLELLQSGRARLFANQRRAKVEEERVTTLDGSYSVQRMATEGSGWQRSQAGADTSFTPLTQMPRTIQPGASNPFDVRSAQELRSRTKHVPAGIGENTRAVIEDMLGEDWGPQFAPLGSAPLYEGWADIWQGLESEDLAVEGTFHANLPPYYRTFLTALRNAVDDAGGSIDAADLIAAIAGTTVNMKRMLATGFSFGTNAGVGFILSAGANIGAGGGMPTLLQTAMAGTSGTILHQGSKTVSSYAQHSLRRFDHALVHSDLSEGQMNRRVERDVPEQRRTERTIGSDVMWQSEILDVVAGQIVLNVPLPALADQAYRTADEAIRIRLGPGLHSFRQDAHHARPDDPRALSECIQFDAWFDVVEEHVRDDH